MRNRPSHRSPVLGRLLRVLLCALLLPVTGFTQGWKRVVQLGEKPGSTIGGGLGNTLYAGLANGPVFRSDDNGVTWAVMTNGLVDKAGGMLVPKAFVVTPTGRVLRGGDNASWDNKVGSPVFRSDNQGAVWTEVALPFASPTRNPGGIAVSDMVLHQGALYFSDLLSEGVWKSTDDGVTWTSAGESLPTLPFVGNLKTYYAIASAGDALLTVQASKGVFRSTDGGATWTQAVNGIAGVVDSPLVGGRTWSGSDVVGAGDGTAFAVSDGRLYRSRDGGASWVEVGAGILQSPNPFAPSIILPSARKVELLGDRVFVSTSDGNPRFFEGTAGGESWTELPRIEGNTGSASLLAQSFAAHNGALYFAGSQGIHRLDLATVVRTNLSPVVTPTLTGPFGLNVGGSLKLAVGVVGTAPFSFEWRLKGAVLPGQTAAELNFVAGSTNDSGALSVVVRNAAGSVTNALGELFVAPAGPGSIDYGFKLVNTANSLLDIIPLPVTLNAFAFGPDGSVFFAGALYSSKERYTGLRKVFADGTPDRSFITADSAPGASSGALSALLPLDDGTLLVGATGTSNDERAYRHLSGNGSLDPSWPWPGEVAGGPRKIVRLADGRFLIAGGSVGGIRRLQADGSFDATFQGPASIGRFQANYVSDFAVLPSGHVVIIGRFDAIDGLTRVGIARLLPSGALDRSWMPASMLQNSTTLEALARLPDGKLLIGGTFASVGGQPRRNLARLNSDGTLDVTLGDLIPGTASAGSVSSFAVQPDGKVWVGGSFTGVSGRNYLFRLNPDGTVDTSFPDIAINRAISSLKWTADGRLWIGGAATRIGGYLAGTPARIFTDFNGPTLGYAGADQMPDAGASITLKGAVTGPFHSLQWRFNGTPIAGQTQLELPLNQVAPSASGTYDLVVNSDAGSSTSDPVQVRVRGPVVIDLPPVPLVGVVSNSATFAVTAFGKRPLAYQWFLNGLAIANATSRTLVRTNLQPGDAGDYSVKVTGGDGSSAMSEPALLTVIPAPGSLNPEFRPSLFRPPGGGTAFLNELKLLPDGRALVGGTFATVTNGPVVMLARLLPDGSVDPTFHFDPTGLGSFEALDLQSDGRIVILARSSAGGAPFVVRRLTSDGSPDTSFPEPELPTASSINIAPDDSILVGYASGLARLAANGTPDSAFAARARMDAPPGSVSIDPAGRIYVGGLFAKVGDQPRRHLARLLPDGNLDASFAPTNILTGSWTVTALADGLLVGDITALYRLNETGRIDPTYAWGGPLAVWELTSNGGLVGVLPTTFGEGRFLDADGLDAAPVSRMTVPASFAGYRRLRVGSDGALWLLLGSNSTFTEPASLLYKLHGTAVSGGSGSEGDRFTDWATAAGLTGDSALPGADPDRDGRSNLAEFYYGTSPTQAGASPLVLFQSSQVGGTDYPAVSLVRRAAVGEISLEVRVASSVDFMDDLGSTVVSASPLGDGFERVVLRSNQPTTQDSAQFFRFTLRRVTP